MTRNILENFYEGIETILSENTPIFWSGRIATHVMNFCGIDAAVEYVSQFKKLPSLDDTRFNTDYNNLMKEKVLVALRESVNYSPQ